VGAKIQNLGLFLEQTLVAVRPEPLQATLRYFLPALGRLLMGRIQMSVDSSKLKEGEEMTVRGWVYRFEFSIHNHLLVLTPGMF
jgi:hypothetical protein